MRIYVCGPTVYGPIHIGNARPFVVFSVLKRYLERRGMRVKLVSNLTDVNDKIYDAARAEGVPSDELARRYSERLRRRHGPAGPGAAGRRADGHRDDAADRRADRHPGGGRARLPVSGGDVYYRVGRFPGYGRLSGRRPDELEPQEPGPGKESPLDFALWKGRKPEEDTWWDSPWGPGPARLAHRVLGHVRGHPRARLRDPRRRHRPDLPPPRERDRPVRRGARRPHGLHLDAQRDARARRREDEQEPRQHRPARRGARPLARRGRHRLLPDQPLPLAPALHRGAHGGGRRGRRAPAQRSRRPSTGPPPAAARAPTRRSPAAVDREPRPPSSTRSTTTSARRRPSPPSSTSSGPPTGRSPGPHGGRRPAPRRPPRAAGAARRARARLDRARAPPRPSPTRSWSCSSRREDARAARDFAAADAARDRVRELGFEITDTPEGPAGPARMSRPRPRPADDREVVYGRNPVRELIAAARRPVHEVRALPQVAREPWLAGLPVRESSARRAQPLGALRRPPGRRRRSPTPSLRRPADLLERAGPARLPRRRPRPAQRRRHRPRRRVRRGRRAWPSRGAAAPA